MEHQANVIEPIMEFAYNRSVYGATKIFTI
jgi:hypothetical protein